MIFLGQMIIRWTLKKRNVLSRKNFFHHLNRLRQVMIRVKEAITYTHATINLACKEMSVLFWCVSLGSDSHDTKSGQIWAYQSA